MEKPFDFRYHKFDVPINWNDPESKVLQIVMREIKEESNEIKPPILFFQGGPGFGCRFPDDQSWIKQLKKHFRVFLMDQRGTGLSTPID
ncbi:MAG: alpha/beta hydrolase [Acidimicrobiia bacterium]